VPRDSRATMFGLSGRVFLAPRRPRAVGYSKHRRASERGSAVEGSAAQAMAFEPVYYADKLEIVNSSGDIGLVTLWTPMRTAKRLLPQLSPGILDPATSRVAVIANLYGDGMHQMMCNLLYNPQIRYLVALGQDLGLPTTEELAAFFAHGLEEATLLGTVVCRIPGTNRILPKLDGFDVERLQRQVRFAHLGKLSGDGAAAALASFLTSIPADTSPVAANRVHVAIPPDDYAYRPSDIGAHQVMRARPLDCWEELVTRAVRFGHPVNLRSGPRRELLNAKVVITDPVEESAELLSDYGFSSEAFREYQEKMLEAVLPQGIAYTYGNRLRGYFERAGARMDTLDFVGRELRHNPESRHAYISLWDTAADLPGDDQETETAVPCLVTIFFRRSADRLTMTATYRSHNLLTAWLQNVYGLMAIQQEICKRTEMPPGPITVISHSLGIDPRSPRYQFARHVADGWKRDEDIDRETGARSLREDPNGYFVVTVDGEAGEIVAEHRYGGLLVKQYRSDRASKIERQVIGDMAVSLVSHALWLGRELSVKEAILRQRVDRRHAPVNQSGSV
jgi:thymidylate synthase